MMHGLMRELSAPLATPAFLPALVDPDTLGAWGFVLIRSNGSSTDSPSKPTLCIRRTTTKPHRREQIHREIEAKDRQIDQLVYQLYGFSQMRFGLWKRRRHDADTHGRLRRQL